MKMKREDVRNIAIIAHVDHGKTTLVDELLKQSGVFRENQEVVERVMDSNDIERERGITILSKNTAVFYKGVKINIIDTPGHVDFTVEVERSLRVLDGSVTVLCAKGGVEPQSETVWRQADEYKVPRMIFVNKMDIMGADFYRALNMVKDRFKCNALPIQLPIGSEDTFEGIIDLVENHAVIYIDPDKEKGMKFEIREIPDDMKELAAKYRTELVEHVAEMDEDLMEKYFEEGEDAITVDEIKKVIRKSTIANSMVPVCCGTAYRNMGVHLMTSRSQLLHSRLLLTHSLVRFVSSVYIQVRLLPVLLALTLLRTKRKEWAESFLCTLTTERIFL